MVGIFVICYFEGKFSRLFPMEVEYTDTFQDLAGKIQAQTGLEANHQFFWFPHPEGKDCGSQQSLSDYKVQRDDTVVVGFRLSHPAVLRNKAEFDSILTLREPTLDRKFSFQRFHEIGAIAAHAEMFPSVVADVSQFSG
jgi:hypothetical protein